MATPALAADTTPPVVGEATPKIATAGTPTTYTAPFVDDGPGGVYQCRLNADGSVIWTSPAYAPNTTSGYVLVAKAFAAGTHYLQFQCVDNAGNWGYGPLTTVAVNTSSDTFPPTTGDVFASVDEPNAGAWVWYYVNANDNVGVSACHLLYDNADIGEMTLQNSGSYAYQIRFPASTSNSVHSVQGRCYDAAGNSSLSQGIKYFTVHGVADNSFPVVGTIQQTSAQTRVAKTLSARVSGSISVCSLFVGGLNEGYMMVANGLASKDYIFTTIGSKPAHVECISATGHVGTGNDVWVDVSNSPLPPDIAYGTLVKLTCPSGAAADHPCKAVYYFGVDGKRHAFPNSKIYFTWYPDFNAVTEISEAQLAAMPLGSNARYRPGKRMVKFTTDPKVYAVAGHGTLRWVTSQALASAFYTADWNRQIDDIPDAFFGNYSFGADITDVNQYNPVGEMNMANSIDADL